MSVPCSVLASRRNPATGTVSRAPGTLVEVRRYVASSAELIDAEQSGRQHASSSHSNNNNKSDTPVANAFVPLLFGFVLWTGTEDRRLCTWLPLCDIHLADGTPLTEHVTSPLINDRIRAPVPAELRQKLSASNRNELDFLEERLRKDSDIPTLNFRVRYLDFSMQPWYFAPYNIVFPAFATTTIATSTSSASPTSSPLLLNKNNVTNDNTSNNPYLFDVHVCPFSLEPFRFDSELRRHLQRRKEDGVPPHPPGKESYRDDNGGLTMYTISGSEHKVFCRNLLIFARNFLENKLVGHDSALYTFYVLTLDYDQVYGGKMNSSDSTEQQSTTNSRRQQPRFVAGYFSVERDDPEHNLACVVVLPCFQSRGLGRFLISYSYEVAKRNDLLSYEEATAAAATAAVAQQTRPKRVGEDAAVVHHHHNPHPHPHHFNNPGTPERPLSDLGESMYHRYWDQLVWSWIARTSRQPRFGANSSADDPIVVGDSPSPAAAASSKKKSGGNNKAAATKDKDDEVEHQQQQPRTTISEIAREIGIAVDDARETLLRLGLVHRTETKSLKLLLPQAYATGVEKKVLQLKTLVKDENFL